MKKIILVLAFALALPCAALHAQRIALGERVPSLKVASWLGDQKPASASELTYVEFFQSSNQASLNALKQLQSLTQQLGGRLSVVVVTQESAEKVSALLTPYLSSDLFVAIDEGNKIGAAFGVQYVPFGVLIDSKNRALWMGNSLQLTPAIIEKSSK